MRKILFIAGLGVFALTSCTSEEVINESSVLGNAIAFENVVNKSTRAENTSLLSALDNSNFNQFSVFGYYVKDGQTHEIFHDELVQRSKDGDSWGAWSYKSEDRFWVPGAKYYFYAYSCDNLKVNFEDGKGLPKITYSESGVNSQRLMISDYVCNKDHQHDLIYAMNETMTGQESKKGDDNNVGAGTGNAPVKFQFKHILSMVDVQFTSGFPDEYDVTITDVTLENIMNMGDYDASPADINVAGDAAEWINVERATEDLKKNPIDNTIPFIWDNGQNLANKTTTVKTGHVYTIPYDYFNKEQETVDGGVIIRFKMSLALRKISGDGTNPPIVTREFVGKFKPIWKIGHHYTYTIQIAGNTADMDAIVFETGESNAFDSWNNGDNNDPEGKPIEISFSSSPIENTPGTTPETPGEETNN